MHESQPGKQSRSPSIRIYSSSAIAKLAKAVQEKNFASGSIVVMNPNNGEVYANVGIPELQSE